MENTTRRRWWKLLLWILFTPVLLFTLLMLILYIPPVQQVLKQGAANIVSGMTGWNVSIGRLDLRFPLDLVVRDVQVIRPADATSGTLHPDTLLGLERLSLRVQALPLLKGQVEVDNIRLENASFNSVDLIDALWLSGSLSELDLRSHGSDLAAKKIRIDDLQLSDADVQVRLLESAAPEDTTETALDWLIEVQQIAARRLKVDFGIPADTLGVLARVGRTEASAVAIDLAKSDYALKSFALSDALVQYDAGADTVMAPGLNPSHLYVFNLHAAADSVSYQDHRLQGIIRELGFDERSGLSLLSLTGRLDSDDEQLVARDWLVSTPHSEFAFEGTLPWSVLETPSTGVFRADLEARMGKEDVMLAAGTLPPAFRQSYPVHPLTLRAGVQGNMQQLRVTDLRMNLPGAFALTGQGDFHQLADSLHRNGQLEAHLTTGNLHFLTSLTGAHPDSTLIIPHNILLTANIGLRGDELTALTNIREQQGTVQLNASYNFRNETYRAGLRIDSLQINHFLPYDSIYNLSARLRVSGQGADFMDPAASAQLEGLIEDLEYKEWRINGIRANGTLQQQMAGVNIVSDNTLLKAQANAAMRLGVPYTEGSIDLDVSQIDLYKLGFSTQPIPQPMAFTIRAEAGKDSLYARIDGGDLTLMFRSRQGLETLMQRGEAFDKLLVDELKNHHLDHVELREALPVGGLFLRGGHENPLGYYLATQGIEFNSLQAGYGFNVNTGINGRAVVHGLKVDSICLDTISFAVRQDTSRLSFHGAVVNGPRHPQITFRSLIDGEIRSEDAELNLTFEDEHGHIGLQLGMNARPVAATEEGRPGGMMIRLTPEEPVIAFRKFQFEERKNWVFLRRTDQRVFTEIDLRGDNNLGIMVKSNDEDTLSLQNVNLELTRMQLTDLSQLMPYLPVFGGIASLDAGFVQTPVSMQVSAEGLIDEFTYEGRRVGDIGLGVTWLPGDEHTHYVDTYLTFENDEVLTSNGSLHSREEQTDLSIAVAFEQFPLRMANAFVPDQMAVFTGSLEGGIAVGGTLEKPRLDGELTFDEVSLYARQAGTTYHFDNRPVEVEASKILFDKFSIYTTADHPLTIDGNISLAKIGTPVADLRVQASDYTLLDAVRSKESLVYGKVYVDINATLRGSLLDGPVMRGNMNVLGNTNATYVLADSPLTVEDRFDGLVTFTSFAEEENKKHEETPAMALGGMDMLMTVHIDDAVRLRSDLSADRSKYVELTGGGDLTMQYTPQGDLNLTGRYTITHGTMKYSLPVIPLKEFTIANGSYVDWRGDVMNPRLSLTATERTRAAVSSGGDDGSRRVDFDIAVIIGNTLEAPDLSFDLSAPNDAEVQNELLSLSADERAKHAITMLATGIYLGGGVTSGGSLTMGTALNSVLQSQINALAGSTMQNANFSMGIENRTDGTGSTLVDYSFRYSQRFFNDRVQVNIGGKVTTGNNAANNAESFIDNVSVEYRVDNSGTRYLRAFHNKNYEDLLDGEITETGMGILFRKKMDSLGELLLFRKKKEDTDDEK